MRRAFGLLTCLTIALACSPRPEPAVFAGRDTCSSCHPTELAEWEGSHHDLAMQSARSDTVLGNFDDARFTHFGVTSRFFRRGDEFWVETDGPDGELAEFAIAYTFGVEPLQQYLIELSGGRLQSLGVAWATERGEWFHLYPDEPIPFDDPLHWTAPAQNWNHACAECHSTDLRKGYQEEGDRFDTRWAEIDVSCEACHGPASNHLRWADTSSLSRWLQRDPSHGLVVDLAAEKNMAEIEVCAVCHSRRAALWDEDRHAGSLLDHHLPSLLLPPLYHADGQIDEEVYVYGSFLQSRMVRENVRCSDCHEPHSLSLRAEGNALCTQCHVPERYDDPSHHHHAVGSTGSSCVECHMPNKTYMVVDPRRDHSLRIPRPDLTVKLDVPNACDACHGDRGAQWAADAVANWFGTERPQHFGELFAAASQGRSAVVPGLEALLDSAQTPGIVRASALVHLQRLAPDGGLRASLQALRDEDPLVRHTALDALRGLPADERLAVGYPLLTDPVRAIRIQAAQVLANVPPEELRPEQASALEAALAEYEAVQQINADQSFAHVNLGIVHADRGQPRRAERNYRKAIELEPGSIPARVNLAHILNGQGRNRETIRLLRDVTTLAPEFAEGYYQLALALAEDERVAEAADQLGRATELAPERSRIHYNHSLALEHSGREAEAQTAAERALALEPDNVQFLVRLALFHSQRGRVAEAREYAQRLVALNPDDPRARELLKSLD